MIIGRVGLIGNGKTMLAVRQATRMADRRGAVLASNIWTLGALPFASWRDERRVQLSVGDDGFAVDELRDLIARCRRQGMGVVLLIDEIGILMPARFWASFPVDLMYQFSQSRKFRLDVLWTSQDVEDVDAYLRRKTQWVYRVRAFPAPTIEMREKDRRPWFFLETRWRPSTVGKRDRRLGWELIVYRRKYEAGYDTDELVAPPERLRNRGKGRQAERWLDPQVAIAAAGDSLPDPRLLGG